jgi:hypothetical protein
MEIAIVGARALVSTRRLATDQFQPPLTTGTGRVTGRRSTSLFQLSRRWPGTVAPVGALIEGPVTPSYQM